MMSASSELRLPRLRGVCAAALLAITATASQAALFSDDEARRAILEVRQRVDAMQQRHSDEMSQVRRSVLDLQQQIDAR